MRLTILLLFLAIASFSSEAQDKIPKRKLSFNSNVALAAMNGSAASSLNIQMVHGFSLRRSFAGAGIGIDYYRFRSIPVFLELRQEFGKGKRSFFVYSDGGYNIDWLTDRTKEPEFGRTVEYKGGWYYDLGMGYKIGLKDAKSLSFSTGYNFKQMRRNVYFKTCLVRGGDCMDDANRYVYTMSRVALRASFQF